MSATYNRSHVLSIHTKGDGGKDAPVSAQCSCGLFDVRNVSRHKARELHGQHLDEYLGPVAQDARERAS